MLTRLMRKAEAVLKERDLEQTLVILRAELTKHYQELNSEAQ